MWTRNRKKTEIYSVCSIRLDKTEAIAVVFVRRVKLNKKHRGIRAKAQGKHRMSTLEKADKRTWKREV